MESQIEVNKIDIEKVNEANKANNVDIVKVDIVKVDIEKVNEANKVNEVNKTNKIDVEKELCRNDCTAHFLEYKIKDIDLIPIDKLEHIIKTQYYFKDVLKIDQIQYILTLNFYNLAKTDFYNPLIRTNKYNDINEWIKSISPTHGEYDKILALKYRSMINLSINDVVNIGIFNKIPIDNIIYYLTYKI